LATAGNVLPWSAFFRLPFGHILSELAHYNWTAMPDDGDCAGIKIRASVLRVAG
jgi:hypothetical protein